MKVMPFKVEQEAGGALILEWLTDPKKIVRQPDMMYRVMFLCCKQIGVIDHRRLADRQRRIKNKDRYERPMKNCGLCAPQQQHRQHREQIESLEVEQGMYDLRGQWWPFLRGPMGPRWGVQNPTVMRKLT